MPEADNFTAVEKAVWTEWNSLDDHPAPVKEIAFRLGMTPGDVAFIVYPAEKFGVWSDDQEPDWPLQHNDGPAE